MVKVPAEQEKAAWAGDLVPAFELDEPEAGDMIVVVVRLIDERQATVFLPCCALPIQKHFQASIYVTLIAPLHHRSCAVSGMLPLQSTGCAGPVGLGLCSAARQI